MYTILASFFWDPDPVAFTLPLLNYPVVWYSLFFALGYVLAYFIVSTLIPQCTKRKSFIESLAWYLFLGMLIGARLGHVIFYDLDYYAAHPMKILYTWEGGLASHGGAIGILVALYFFWKKHGKDIPDFSFRKLLDILVLAIGVAGGCIRLGNFFNQEILGIATSVPWSVYFGHPSEPNSIQPCHPVQLYEALFYFATSLILYVVFRKKQLADGKIAGLFFIAVFTFRFCIEWLKLPQSAHDMLTIFSTGQLLSIPFILLGIYLLMKSRG